jgi:flagellar biosynthesis protein FliR
MNWLEALSALSGLGQEILWPAFVVFLRAGALMALLPAFGEQSVPARIRLVLALAFTAVVAPAVAPDLPTAQTAFGRVMAGEVAAGLVIGAGIRFFVHALQIAGAIAAQATTLSQAFPSGGPEPQPAIGQILVVSGLALATATGLHVHVAEVLIRSYGAFPAGSLPVPGEVARWGIGQIGRAFALGFSLAVPFLIASVLYNVALGIINRAMPMLMVSLVGAPAQTLGGLILLAVATPPGLAIWLAAMGSFLDQPFTGVP